MRKTTVNFLGSDFSIRYVKRNSVILSMILAGLLGSSCVRNTPPVEPEAPEPPPPSASAAIVSEERPESLPEAPLLPPPPFEPEDEFQSRTLEEINRDTPLQPVFFGYDSSELNNIAVTAISANVDILENFPTWVITIEGHCDERGTPEYNLGLGERRALVVREYLVELGIATSQLRTVSYGKEFPFESGETEQSWSANRRAHFVITAQ